MTVTTRPARRPQFSPPRNGPCLCGSGLKFKRCCADRLRSDHNYDLRFQAFLEEGKFKEALYPLHRTDLGEICHDVVIAAALAGGQMEATAREHLGRTRTAEMNYRGDFLLCCGRSRLAVARESRRYCGPNTPL
jgi:hypothetical protein